MTFELIAFTLVREPMTLLSVIHPQDGAKRVVPKNTHLLTVQGPALALRERSHARGPDHNRRKSCPETLNLPATSCVQEIQVVFRVDRSRRRPA